MKDKQAEPKNYWAIAALTCGILSIFLFLYFSILMFLAIGLAAVGYWYSLKLNKVGMRMSIIGGILGAFFLFARIFYLGQVTNECLGYKMSDSRVIMGKSYCITPSGMAMPLEEARERYNPKPQTEDKSPEDNSILNQTVTPRD